jgi:hypothetical protein
MPIHLANPLRYIEEVMAEVAAPPTADEILRRNSDLQWDLLQAIDELWRFGGEEGRAWVREHHPRDATRLEAVTARAVKRLEARKG